jgi:excisionase family DNA binding protein
MTLEGGTDAVRSRWICCPAVIAATKGARPANAIGGPRTVVFGDRQRFRPDRSLVCSLRYDEVVSVLEITPDSSDRWVDVIRGRLAEGESARVSFHRPSMTPEQMAESIGVSRATIMRRVVTGEIRTERRGNRHRILLAEVERFRHSYVREMARDLARDF